MSIARKLILAIFCVALTPAVLADKVKDVNVVNTPTVNANIVNANPIAVTGEVDVSGPLEATIAGPLDVSGSAVEIANSDPILVSDVATSNIESQIQLAAGSGGSAVCGTSGAQLFRATEGEFFFLDPYVLPSNRKLIIKSISFDITGGPVNQQVLFSIDRGNSPNSAFRSRVPTDSNGDGAQTYTIEPGAASLVELCFKYPTVGTSQVNLYGYVVNQ